MCDYVCMHAVTLQECNNLLLNAHYACSYIVNSGWSNTLLISETWRASVKMRV